MITSLTLSPLNRKTVIHGSNPDLLDKPLQIARSVSRMKMNVSLTRVSGNIPTKRFARQPLAQISVMNVSKQKSKPFPEIKRKAKRGTETLDSQGQRPLA